MPTAEAIGEFVFLVVFVALLLGMAYWTLKQPEPTEREMKALAGDAITSLREQLPYDLPQELLARLPASLQVRRCFAGWMGGERVVSFSYAKGWGNQKQWRNVVVVRREHPENAVRPQYGQIAWRHENWVAATPPWYWLGLSAKQVVDQWKSLKTVFGEEGERLQKLRHVHGELVMRPRHQV